MLVWFPCVQANRIQYHRTEHAKGKNFVQYIDCFVLQNNSNIIAEFVQWMLIFHDFKDFNVNLLSLKVPTTVGRSFSRTI